MDIVGPKLVGYYERSSYYWGYAFGPHSQVGESMKIQLFIYENNVVGSYPY